MGRVIFDAETRTWLLDTPGSCYVLRLDDEDTPRHVHWGPRLSIETARAIALSGPAANSFDGTDDAEVPVESGAMFGVPTLSVRYPDGACGVEWRYEIDGGHLRITLRDRAHPLWITMHYRVFNDSGVIQRWLTLRSDEPVRLLRCDSARFVLPPREAYRVSHVVGSWSREFQVRQTELPVGETVFTSRRGITSHQANPWLMVDAGGEVWSAALAWSGSWRITVQHTASGRVSVSGGFGHDGVMWKLGPGEEWTTPMLAGLYTSDGLDAAGRAWHAYIRTHVLPHPDELPPIVYNSWEAVGFDLTEVNQKHLATLAAELVVAGCTSSKAVPLLPR